MKVSVRSGGCVCECASVMEFLDPPEVQQRKMQCSTPTCRNFKRIVLEPLFNVADVPKSADDDTQEFIPVKPDLTALRDAAQGDGTKDAGFAVSRRR